MLLPFLWRRSDRWRPEGAWGWDGMYLLDGDIETILTGTLRDFFSAHPDDILLAGVESRSSNAGDDWAN